MPECKTFAARLTLPALMLCGCAAPYAPAPMIAAPCVSAPMSPPPPALMQPPPPPVGAEGTPAGAMVPGAHLQSVRMRLQQWRQQLTSPPPN